VRALEGITVLDLTHAVAGPFCTYQLHQLGARVIKVEKPRGGDDLRNYVEHGGEPEMSAPFVALNAGKLSITLDLNAPEAREIMLRLISTADVLIENFRPGVASRLGLGWDDVHALRPDLIYCSISGFGQTGPLRNWSAYDHIVQAMSGMVSLNGEPEGEPVKLAVPVSDVFSGYMAGFAILAALLQRAGDGLGQRIDVSMLDASLVLMTPIIGPYLASGREPTRQGNLGFRRVASSGTFATKDGLLVIAAQKPDQFAALCRVLDRPDIATDPRFVDHVSRVAHPKELEAALNEAFKDRSGVELEPLLAAARVPVSLLRSVPQIIEHQHLAERGTLAEIEVGAGGRKTRSVGAGFLMEHDGPRVTGPVPVLGANSEQLLGELGYDEQNIARLRAEGIV
jgi:crotonobetainyl-CoA:carnitine CoA-transferase CaiB-like acyl-CoA transferase